MMMIKVFDANPEREVPADSVNLSEYMTVQQAHLETGLERGTIYSHVHQSRRVGSIQVGNSRLVKRADVLALAEALGIEPTATLAHSVGGA